MRGIRDESDLTCTADAILYSTCPEANYTIPWIQLLESDQTYDYCIQANPETDLERKKNLRT